MGSVAELEGVLTALQYTLSPLGLELNLRKTTVWSPVLVPAASPLAPATRLHLEGGTEVFGVPVHSALYPSPVGAHGGTLEGKFARTFAAVAAWRATRAPTRSCGLALGPRKSSTRSAPCLSATRRPSQRTSLRPSGPRGTRCLARPGPTRRGCRHTLPLSEGGCGFASASDMAPVARLAGVMQVLPRAEQLLGCDRQLVVPLATEAGLLDALNARLPPALEPLAIWTRTGKVELPDGDVRRQHWWSARLTHVKAAALLEAATGRNVPRLEAQRAGKADGWLSPPTRGGPRSLPGWRQLLHSVEEASGRAPTTGGLRGQTVPPVWRAGGHFRRPRRIMQEVGLRGYAPYHSIIFLPGPYPSPDPA